MKALESIIKRHHAIVQSVATKTEIEEFETLSGLTVPLRAKVFFERCNGMIFGTEQIKLIPLKKSLEHINLVREYMVNHFCGYMPLTDTEDSDTFAICCNGPLKGYIVHLPHDDSSRLMFRSLDSFLNALNTHEVKAALYWDKDVYELDEDFEAPELRLIESDFDKRHRTKKEEVICDSLFEMAEGFTGNSLLDNMKQDAYRFAIWLLPEEKLNRLTLLFDKVDEYVRRDIIARLNNINNADAKNALTQIQRKFDNFLAESIRDLQSAGIDAVLSDRKSVLVNPGHIWLNMESFYSMRNEPKSKEYLIERVQHLIKLKSEKA